MTPYPLVTSHVRDLGLPGNVLPGAVASAAPSRSIRLGPAL